MDCPYFRYFIFPFISLVIPLSGCSVPQLYVFSSNCMSLFSTVTVTVLVLCKWYPSLSSCTPGNSKPRILLAVIYQYTPPYYICKHPWIQKPGRLWCHTCLGYWAYKLWKWTGPSMPSCPYLSFSSSVGLTCPSFLREVMLKQFLLTRWILQYCVIFIVIRPASWSSGQGLWLLILRSRVWFPVLP